MLHGERLTKIPEVDEEESIQRSARKKRKSRDDSSERKSMIFIAKLLKGSLSKPTCLSPPLLGRKKAREKTSVRNVTKKTSKKGVKHEDFRVSAKQKRLEKMERIPL